MTQLHEGDLPINLIDKRTEQIIKTYPDGIKDRHNPLIPDGVINKLRDLKAKDKEGVEHVIGDVEQGDDGFLEIMYLYDAGFIKIKSYKDENDVFLSFVPLMPKENAQKLNVTDEAKE